MIETISRNGHTLDVLTSGDLRMMVSRNGAELVSLARRDSGGEWHGFLVRDGDVSKNPDGWNNHSTVMGYYIHRLLDGKSTYHGHPVEGGTHSFLRHRVFPAPDFSADSMTYHFDAQQLAPGEYPFQVDFAIIYSLTAAGLRVDFRMVSREDFPTHVSFGLHPGFAVADLQLMHVLLPAGRYIRHLAPGNFLSGETVTLDFPGGPMPFAVGALPDSYLLDLADVPDRVIILEDPPTGRRTVLDFSEAPYMTLWSDGHPFICIEPCWGLPDHQVQRPFEEKLGIQTIPARGTLQRGFSIRPEFFTASPG